MSRMSEHGMPSEQRSSGGSLGRGPDVAPPRVSVVDPLAPQVTSERTRTESAANQAVLFDSAAGSALPNSSDSPTAVFESSRKISHAVIPGMPESYAPPVPHPGCLQDADQNETIQAAFFGGLRGIPEIRIGDYYGLRDGGMSHSKIIETLKQIGE